MGEVLHVSLLKLLLEHCDFLNIDILQGSVATRLRCGGIFKHELVANLLVNLPVKEFWKSVNIWGSYGQEFGVLFFSETQCINKAISPISKRILYNVLNVLREMCHNCSKGTAMIVICSNYFCIMQLLVSLLTFYVWLYISIVISDMRWTKAVCVGHDYEPCKTAEPIVIRGRPRNHNR